MDRETAERLTKLEVEMSIVNKERAGWNKLMVKVISWLMMVGISTVLYGWHLPENVRKALTEWIAK